MPRPLTIQDFPQSIQASILCHSPPDPRSLLIMFHGLGDSHAPLFRLGQQLNLPSTTVISVKAPSPIPAIFMGREMDGMGGGTGWHWGDDILVEDSTGELDLDTGFSAAAKLLGKVVKVVLGDPKGEKSAAAMGKEDRNLGTSKPPGGGELGFEKRDVFLWGFGQGGMVALSLAEAFGTELGGVISIGGKPPSSKSAMAKAVEVLSKEVVGERTGGTASPATPPKAKTPVLLCGGNRHTAVTTNVLRDVKERFGSVQYVKWERDGDSMARNREEMLPIMKFLASRLRMPAPAGMEEVKAGGFGRA